MKNIFSFQNYLITSSQVVDLPGLLRKAVAGGIQIVQLRDKEASDVQILKQAQTVLPFLRAHQVELIINDRLGVAAQLGLGLHIGIEDEDPKYARSILGDDVFIGLTIHDQIHLAEKYQAWVDYVGVGPIFATQTKKDAKKVLGVDVLAEICCRSILPVVAVGGITLQNAAAVIKANPVGIAICSAICHADDPEEKAREISKLWLLSRS